MAVSITAEGIVYNGVRYLGRQDCVKSVFLKITESIWDTFP